METAGSPRAASPDWTDEAFCKRLPKIELHAHLTGSIRRETLGEIWRRRKEQEPDFTLEDPLIAMPSEKRDFGLSSFFPLFSKYTYNLVNSEWSVQYATEKVLKDFEADGVVYLELRTIPRGFEETGLTKEKYVDTVLSTIRNYPSNKLHTRLILSVDRQNTAEEAMDTVELALKHKDEGIIVGIDLCGNPGAGDVRIFRNAFKTAKEGGLGITLHFAEIERQPIKDELDILLSFQPHRLGHAIHTNERVNTEIRRRKLCLELCLSCNIYAKMLPKQEERIGLAGHHFKYWWRKTECPIALGTDDVGVFLSELSNEYYLASQHFQIRKDELWNLGFYAVDSIFADQAEKDHLRNVLLIWGKENQLDVEADDESVNEII